MRAQGEQDRPTSDVDRGAAPRRTWGSLIGDGVIVLVLLVATTMLVLRTNDMGFSRDETFYFGHAEAYQDWLVKVAAGGEARQEALSKTGREATWVQNSEHPPLAKWAFGLSWRAFGEKWRPVKTYEVKDDGSHVRVSDLGPSHGFSKGATVRVLAPRVIDDIKSEAEREIARGTVVERRPYEATVRLDSGIIADAQTFSALCPSAGPAPEGLIRLTGCEAIEIKSSHLMRESDAMRLPGAIATALLVAAIYLTGRRALRRPFALAAALGFLLLPRPFYHAHQAAFDMAIATLLFIVTTSYHRSLQSRAWAGVTAALWGLALLTKHNALFLPVPLMLHWMIDGVLERTPATPVRRPPVEVTLDVTLIVIAACVGWMLASTVGALGLALLVAAARGRALRLPPIPLAYFVMAPVGFTLLVAGWPWLWSDGLDHFLRWIEFHLHHEHYMQYYFHRVLAYPPFPIEYAWALTVLTFPLPTAFATLTGFVAVWWRRLSTSEIPTDPRPRELRSFDRLLLISALWPMALISMPGTPIFGDIKHWMPAYPFLLLIAGRGLQWTVSLVLRDPHPHFSLPESPGRFSVTRAVLSYGVAALVLAPAGVATFDVHPHGPAYWNELIGGVPGGADKGMQRQFWGSSTREGLDEVNRRAGQSASVYFHKSTFGAFRMYQREGWLRHDLRYDADPQGSALGLYHHQKDHDDYELEMMRDYGARSPVLQYALHGVPILSVYERP